MSDGATLPPGGPTPRPAPTGRRRRRARLAGLVTLLLIGGGAAWWFSRPVPYEPPEPPSFPAQDGADPAVVSATGEARAKVLANRRDGPAWGDLGMVFGAHGFESEADQCFAVAERLDPKDPRWPYFRGLFAAVSNPGDTAGHLRRALAANPPADARAAVRLQLAEVLFERQDVDAAEALFREELARAPDDPRARFGLAQIALTRGDRGAAREAFAALADNPYARARAAAQASALARADGDLDAARRFEERARRAGADPSWPDPYRVELRKKEVGQSGLLREVDALVAAGQTFRATELLLELVRDHPTPRLLVTAGIHLAKLRNFDRAEAVLRECLRQDPTNSQANYFLCVVLFERAGQLAPHQRAEAQLLFRDAVKAGRAAVATKPDHGLAWLYLGRALLGTDEPVAAVEALRQAVACRPEFVDTHLHLAEALAATNERAEAVRSAQNAEKLAQPGDPRPRQLLDRLESPVTPKK